MFFLIGGDGRKYGPFSAEQIREWLAQGRANAHSRIRRDGDATWQPLQDVAEFADVASVSPPPPGAPPPPLSPESIAAGYLAHAAPVDISSCLSRGWALVRDNPGLTIGATLLIMLVSFGLSMLPVIGLLGFFINPVLLGGLAYVFSRRIRGENPDVGDAFNGFSLAFLQLGLSGLVSFVLICVGRCCARCRASTSRSVTCSRCSSSSTRSTTSGPRWKSAAASSTASGGRCLDWRWCCS